MSSFDLTLILSQDRPVAASETRILPMAVLYREGNRLTGAAMAGIG
jgi:hypothetical protein